MSSSFQKVRNRVLQGHYTSITNARRAAGGMIDATPTQKKHLQKLINEQFKVSLTSGSAGMPKLKEEDDLVDVGAPLVVKTTEVRSGRLKLVASNIKDGDKAVTNLFARVAAILAPGAGTADWLELLGVASSMGLSLEELTSIVTVGVKIAENSKKS